MNSVHPISKHPFLDGSMSKKRMFYFGLIISMLVVGYFGWKLMARGAYESAAYTVVESEGSFEVREYPDLMLAATNTRFESQGNDGSFGRLFRYISGDNDRSQKVAMTTPVFMEPESEGEKAQMGFVIPKEVMKEGIPQPTAGDVEIRKREGGTFAVVRFSGQLNEESRSVNEKRLRKWMNDKGLSGEAAAESAGYDPPFKPKFLRRNEVLIRLDANAGQ